MKVGKLSQAVGQNLYSGGWQLIHEKLFDAAATSYTISGLDGDNDEEYRLIVRCIANADDMGLLLRVNNDTGTNYGHQQINAVNADKSSARGTYSGIVPNAIGLNDDTNDITMFDCLIYAKSGKVRTIIHKYSGGISGTTVTEIGLTGQSWNNTADNITSLVILTNKTNGIGIDTHLFLFKRQKLGSEATTGMRVGKQELQGKLNVGTFQKIYSTTLTEAATSVTISDLDGDTDTIYKLRCRLVAGANNTNNYIKLNNISGSYYGYQYIQGAGSDIEAYRDSNNVIYNGWCETAGYIDFTEHLIYAKSGYVRTVLSKISDSITGTTLLRVWLFGQVFNNTVDNITSIVFSAAQTNGIGVGSVIELFALRKL